jgi:hypothetical protein
MMLDLLGLGATVAVFLAAVLFIAWGVPRRETARKAATGCPFCPSTDPIHDGKVGGQCMWANFKKPGYNGADPPCLTGGGDGE